MMSVYLRKIVLAVGLGLLALLLARHAKATGDSCLLLGGPFDSGSLDITTGTYTQIPFLPADQLPRIPLLPHALSPNRQHIAIIDLSAKIRQLIRLTVPIKLTVQPLARPLPLGQAESLLDMAVATNDVDVFWTPDSQRIIYRW